MRLPSERDGPANTGTAAASSGTQVEDTQTDVGSHIAAAGTNAAANMSAADVAKSSCLTRLGRWTDDCVATTRKVHIRVELSDMK